jgi:hypothetical protein
MSLGSGETTRVATSLGAGNAKVRVGATDSSGLRGTERGGSSAAVKTLAVASLEDLR